MSRPHHERLVAGVVRPPVAHTLFGASWSSLNGVTIAAWVPRSSFFISLGLLVGSRPERGRNSVGGAWVHATAKGVMSDRSAVSRARARS